MYHFHVVLVLVTVVPSYVHVQALVGAPLRLNTTYSISRTLDSAQVFLRVGAHSVTVPSLAVALQTNLGNCTFEVNSNYTGEVLQATGRYGRQALEVTVLGVRRLGDEVRVDDAKLLSVTWRPKREERFKIVTPRATISLAGGSEGEVGGRWWKLWAWDSDVEGEGPAGDSAPLHPDEGGGEAGRGVLVRTYTAAPGVYGWGLSVDAFLSGDRHRLLTLTFTAHHERSWQVNLQIPLLSVALDCKSVWKSEGKQHWQVAVEVKSSTSGASLKLVHWELKEHNEKAKHTGDNGEPGGLSESLNTDGDDACRSSGSSLEDELKKQPEHQENRPDACSNGGEDTGLESLPSGATHEIRQSITSSVFNYSSNMTTFPSPDGGRSVRILQRSHLAFCPRLSWTLNQMFRFRPDWSGWEYVVMGWDWGGMVVRGEWGTSLLQWYQKTFAFSFDQGAPLPSTHLVLDFRDWRSYKVWLRWPVLAFALTASITVEHDRHELLVKEVDEFLGEGAAVELARVEAQHSSAGLTLTSSFSASRIRELHAAANLAMVSARRAMCGEVPNHTTFDTFLHRLLGQPPEHLWDSLLLKSRRLLLGFGSQTNFQHLWEVLEEEIGTAGGEGDVWGLAWTWLERAGMVEVRGEGRLKVFVPAEWLGLVQRVLAWAGGATSGRCEGSELVERLLEVVAGALLRRGGHHHTAAS